MEYARTTECAECLQLKKTLHKLRAEIARQRQETDVLRESLKAYTEIFQAMPAALIVCQYQPPGELFCLTVNPAAKSLTGVQRDRCLGVELDEMWPGARGQGLTQAFVKTAQTGESFLGEAAFYRFGVAKRIFRVRAFRLPGNRIGVAFSDVTDEKLAENVFRLASQDLEEELKARTAQLSERIKNLEGEVRRLRQKSEGIQ